MKLAQHLDNYFKQARTWADDNFGRIEQSRRRYQLAFLTSMGLNIAAIVTVCVLSHYQTILPLMVHHYDNGITTIEQTKHNQIHRAQVESDIVRYIQHREAYDISSYRAQFELITILSNSKVSKEYLVEQDKANSTAPIKLLGYTSKREVHIYSINFLDSILENEKDIHRDHYNLAEVVFSLIDTDKTTGKAIQSHYNAMLSWHYITPSNSPEIRWQNWNGFEVTRYSKQPRHVESQV